VLSMISVASHPQPLSGNNKIMGLANTLCARDLHLLEESRLKH
jgi:hypothetical protein